MISKSEALERIKRLVDRFDDQYETYKAAGYNETQTRRDFIDPFFKSLGWDVDNEQGYAEAYREVIHEDKVTVKEKDGERLKSPDYSFRLAGGKRLFFLEAKKPSIFVKDDILPAYQVRRYGWSAKLPISLVTDFEEFAVYDCTKKPSPKDKASFGRLRYLTFRDYVKEFDFIWNTFSKERVLKGSFDQFVKSDTHKKGTATVDKEFLQSLDNWRTLLAIDLSKQNKELTEEELNYAVQAIIDRIIFLRIAEDREVEPYGNLRECIKQGDFYENLCAQFVRADEKYNSGLFDFKKDKLTKGLQVENKVIKSIINDLYYPNSPYEFSVLSVEILGSAYEQFLGKQIRIDKNHKAKIEEKPEVRKAGGVYYTPQYIVDYIVQNTVGKLVEGKNPKEVSEITICDPACGSGSFLLGAYQFLLDWHKDYYSKHPFKGKTKENPLTPDGRLTTAEKKRILLNNIYGVDLDANAVEVTKLSLLLKCMEGETENSISLQIKLFQERVLPSLEDNIKCGNSLVDFDLFDAEIPFENEIHFRPFNWKSNFPKVFINKGFDAIIGNPPYVRQESLGEIKLYFSKRYNVYHGMADLYTYFIEKGISLLKHNGLFGIIVANKWMKNKYGKPLRNYIKKLNLIYIIDFEALPIFQNATTYTCILIISNTTVKSKSFMLTKVKSLDFSSLTEYSLNNRVRISINSLDDDGWTLGDESETRLLDKLISSGIQLNKYVNNQIYRGVLTGLNEAFVIDEETKYNLIKNDPNCSKIIKSYLAGKDIKRYNYPIGSKYLIFTRRGININEYPSVKNHLLNYKEKLTPRPKDYNGSNWKGRKPGNYEWFEIQDTVEYYKLFEGNKILWPGISSVVNSFTIDFNSHYGNDNVNMIISDDLYLLGVLNSRVTKYQLLNKCDKVQGGFYRLKLSYISNLSIIIPNNNDELHLRNRIYVLVKNILDLHEKLKNNLNSVNNDIILNKISHLEDEIDIIVYKLYKLDSDEINTISSYTK